MNTTVPASLGFGRRLYLDLDGVMADFDAHYVNLFGAEASEELLSDTVWDRINTVRSTFFATMPLCPGATEFLVAIRHLNPTILTACPREDYANVAGQKRYWVRANLGDDLTVLPSCGGRTKPLFMHQQGDVLIDDVDRNCRAWANYGGNPILHRSFPETVAALAALAA